MPRRCLLFAVWMVAVSNAGCSGCSAGDNHRHGGVDSGGPLIDGAVIGIDIGRPPPTTTPGRAS